MMETTETHKAIESQPMNGFPLHNSNESQISGGRELSPVVFEGEAAPETHSRFESHCMNGFPPQFINESHPILGRESGFALLRYTYEGYKDVQAARIRIQNRERQFKEMYQHTDFPFDPLEPVWNQWKPLKKEESSWQKTAEQALNTYPVWAEHLQGVKGIGPVLGCGLLGFIENPKRFPGLRSLYHYAGLHVVEGAAPKRRRGSKINWNPKLRCLLWNVSKCLVRSKNEVYYPLYRKFKEDEKTKHPELTKGHVDNRALRKMQKRFLRDLWSYWHPPETHLATESQFPSGFPPQLRSESHFHPRREWDADSLQETTETQDIFESQNKNGLTPHHTDESHVVFGRELSQEEDDSP